MAKFEGTVEAFRYTPGVALETNAIVTVGSLLGVTRDKCAAGETIMAFMSSSKSIYSFPLATSPAVAAIDRGEAVAIDSAGKIKVAGPGDAVVGIAWEDVAVGDTEAVVMLNDTITPVDESDSGSGST